MIQCGGCKNFLNPAMARCPVCGAPLADGGGPAPAAARRWDGLAGASFVGLGTGLLAIGRVINACNSPQHAPPPPTVPGADKPLLWSVPPTRGAAATEPAGAARPAFAGHDRAEGP